jgi:curved DNA-binding protein CbpA
MSFDPYALLGVARTAPAAAIKTAYRAAVQTAHPDRGGDPERFILIVKAFGLLSDPEARRLYDETGDIDENAVASFRRDVAKILADMFDAAVGTAVATGLDLGRVDFVRQMTGAVRTGLSDARAGLIRADRDIAALMKLRQRIKRADAGQNLFAERLEAQIAARTEQQMQAKRRVLLLETAVVEAIPDCHLRRPKKRSPKTSNRTFPARRDGRRALGSSPTAERKPCSSRCFSPPRWVR